MSVRRLRMRAPLLLIALVGLTACATPEDRPADIETVDEGGSDPFIDNEDAEGLPEDDLFEDSEAEQEGPPDEAALTLKVATSEEYGEYLVDGDELALYVSATDPPGESTCTDDCLEQWPVFSVGEEPTVAEGIDEELVGTLERDDLGEDRFEQVTFREKPLHYYRLDQRPGMTTGQGIDDRWFLIGPDGVEIRD
jgi:predicted lipoprotein with Yx(FWY)xxD motif